MELHISRKPLCSTNSKLQVLDLSSNNIGADGAAHFKEALCSTNCKLQVLDLSANNIGADGTGTGTGTHKLYWHVTHLQSQLPKQYLRDL